MKNKAKNTTLS